MRILKRRARTNRENLSNSEKQRRNFNGSVLIAFTLLCLFFACTKDANWANNKPNFEFFSFIRSSSSCTVDSNFCAKVQLYYPLAIEGKKTTLKRINDTILKHLSKPLSYFSSLDEKKDSSLEALSKIFFEEYETLVDGKSRTGTPWIIEVRGELIQNNRKWVTIELVSHSYYGGANANAQTTFLNFDKSTGATLELMDVVSDYSGFSEVVKKNYFDRIPNSQDDDADSFFTEVIDFDLPENFAMLEDGILFYYNTYEIAPYKVAPNALFVSYEELKPYLRLKVR